jgi:glycerol-3-phosphate dehydrogenase
MASEALGSGQHGDFDLAVVGGGINGAGIARDAAGRGARVLLVEQGDLASATSSASTKLIHGGLRYLEAHEFRLVRESLSERETLLRLAPHIAWPLRFVLPHHRGLRPYWLIRLGLILYDHLGRRRILPSTAALDLTRDPAGRALKPEFRRGFAYSDCWVDDARLVVLNAVDARERGADIRTRTRCAGAVREDGLWTLTLEDVATGQTSRATAGTLVNATGPWAGRFLSEIAAIANGPRVRLVRGSHIVVRRLFDHASAYIFQNADGRVCFAIPYDDGLTLIGTTDCDHDGDPGAVAITPEEIDYLCRAVSAYLRTPVVPSDVVWSYSGVRPLLDDGASEARKATRDYELHLDAPAGAAPLLNVIGGKLTTYRRLAEAVLAVLAGRLTDRRGPWTAGEPLPGGEIAWNGTTDLAVALSAEHPFLDPAEIYRMVRTYGTRAHDVLDGVGGSADLGRQFGAGLSEREVTYLMDHEFACTAEDVLWRRTKLGLKMAAGEAEALADWMAARRAAGFVA